MAKRPIVVDTTIDSPLAALGVNFAKDVPKPKADAPRLAWTTRERRSNSEPIARRASTGCAGSSAQRGLRSVSRIATSIGFLPSQIEK